MSFVTFTSDNGLVVKALLGEASPTMVGGYGGWEVVDRPKRVGLTRWKGRDPFRQDVSIMFDGYANSISQETAISRLERMALQPGSFEQPPTVLIDGMVQRTDLTWIIENIDFAADGVIWQLLDNEYVRVRQPAVVHLLQFVDDNIIVTPPSPAVAGAPGKTGKLVPVPQGMSLRQIAQWAYGDPDLYLQILFANPFLDPDPRKVIKAGTVIFLPGIGSWKVTFEVAGRGVAVP